jgi:hypothetical protein
MRKFTIHAYDLASTDLKDVPVCQAFMALYERARILNKLILQTGSSDTQDELLEIIKDEKCLIFDEYTSTAEMAEYTLAWYVQNSEEVVHSSSVFSLVEFTIRHKDQKYVIFYVGRSLGDVIKTINERQKEIMLAWGEAMVSDYMEQQRAEFATMKGERGEEMD